jgi:hypothetical protein
MRGRNPFAQMRVNLDAFKNDWRRLLYLVAVIGVVYFARDIISDVAQDELATIVFAVSLTLYVIATYANYREKNLKAQLAAQQKTIDGLNATLEPAREFARAVEFLRVHKESRPIIDNDLADLKRRIISFESWARDSNLSQNCLSRIQRAASCTKPRKLMG